MLTEIYIEALLVDDELADQVWKVWDAGEIDDAVAYTAWILIAAARFGGDTGTTPGAAYVFTRNAGIWSEQQKLTAADGAAGDELTLTSRVRLLWRNPIPVTPR